MFSHISFPPRFEFLFWWYDLNLFSMIFSQKVEFYKSCSTRWLFLYYLWRSTLKIMIKVPVNLIRQNHAWRCRNWMTQLYVLHLNVDKVLPALCQALRHICRQQWSHDRLLLELQWWTQNTIQCAYEIIRPRSGRLKVNSTVCAQHSNWLRTEMLPQLFHSFTLTAVSVNRKYFIIFH